MCDCSFSRKTFHLNKRECWIEENVLPVWKLKKEEKRKVFMVCDYDCIYWWIKFQSSILNVNVKCSVYLTTPYFHLHFKLILEKGIVASMLYRYNVFVCTFFCLFWLQLMQVYTKIHSSYFTVSEYECIQFSCSFRGRSKPKLSWNSAFAHIHLSISLVRWAKSILYIKLALLFEQKLQQSNKF